MKTHFILFAFSLISLYSRSTEVDGGAICPTIFMSGSGVSCYGSSDGNASVQATNGSGNYSYSWSNGGNTSSINGLTVGTYTVNVIDNVTGCNIVGAYVVGSPDPISTTAQITDINCYGQNTGAIDLLPLGGSNPMTFSWSNGASTEDLTSITAGVYTIDISDANGCLHSKTYTVIEPLEALQGAGAVTNTDCFGASTGSIDIDVWGGTLNYAYSWNSGEVTQDIANVPAGNYILSIVDQKNCLLDLFFVITQPTVLGGSGGSTDVLCNGEATGTAFYTPTGGTSPYNYSWQNSTSLFSVNSANLLNVPADNYQITVTDDNGCVFIDNLNVGEPLPLGITETHQDVSCYGGSDGNIDVTISGGVPNYSYSWTNDQNATIQNIEDLNNIPTGTYTLDLMDNNNCHAFLTQFIDQPVSPIDAQETVVDVLCFGDNTGSIDLFISGGTPPYSVSWTNGLLTEDIANLFAGPYGYSIVDANGCIYSGSVTVTQPLNPISSTFSIIDANCYGESNGSIDITPSGGTSPYTYYWTNSTFVLSATQQDLINFPADVYTVIITDTNNCDFTQSYSILEPEELLIAFTKVDVSCYGDATGSIDATITGGSIPYSYQWSNNSTTQDLNNLMSGMYTLTVSDDHLCSAIDSIQIFQPTDTISFTSDVVDVICNGGNTGEIELEVFGGTSPYTYLWANTDVVPDIINLTSGYYVFQVTDANNCIFIDSIFVDETDPITAPGVVSPVSCFGGEDGKIDVSPQGGTMPYTYTWLNSTFTLSVQTQDLDSALTDVYQLEIIDSNGCFFQNFYNVPQPDSLEISYIVKPVTCYGFSDGEVDITIENGGTPSFSALWSNGTTVLDLINSPSDTVFLVLIDANNCVDTTKIFIPQPDTMIITIDHDPMTCIDIPNGIAYASTTGGNGSYAYEWSNGTMDAINTGLGNETYYVTVIDLLGCEGEESIFITKREGSCLDPPSAFTPNGDNYNDTWYIENLDLYPNSDVQIFNKWGNIVHSQSGMYEPWDGKIRGAAAPAGTYYYLIKLNYLERESVYGNVSILR